MKPLNWALPWVTTLFLMISFSEPAVAQKSDIKFGRIAPDEMKPTLTGIEDASAVVLFDRGHFNGKSIVFTRNLRIKILTSSGTGMANFAVRTPTKSDIRGYTYNLRDGEIVKTKLEKDNIFTEEIVEGYKVYKIFFPAVEPGSVIDLEYSFYGLPYTWEFQRQIPVLHSELILEPCTYISYKKLQTGFFPINQINEQHWIAENVPPLQEEPFMSYYGNYLTKFDIEIEKLNFGAGTGLSLELSKSWEGISVLLLKSLDFGGIANGCSFLSAKARELKESTMTTREKVDAAMAYIKENIKWNSYSTYIVSKDYVEHFKKTHSGNSAEINLMLIGLLNQADIKTYPVVLSTRDNGLLNPTSAYLSKLNYVVGYVRHDGESILLDATSPYAVPGVLPENCLNHNGWLVDRTAGTWIDLAPQRAHSVKQYVRIVPAAKSFKAEVSTTYEDYAFLDWIEKYDAEGEDPYLRRIASHYNLPDIESHTIKSSDANALKAVEYTVVPLGETEHVQDLGKEMLISPFVLHDFENPFKDEQRKYPIDLVKPRSESILVSITIPDEFVLKSVPESLKLTTPDGSAKFQFLCNAVNNNVNIRCDVIISRSFFTENEYGALRNFFSEVIRKLNEPIHLDKKT